MAGQIYEFGDFRLDCGRFELLRNGRSIKLERKPMELLILLASRKGQLVTRTEIAQQLWDSEVFVDTEHGINTAVRKIRNVLRDDSEEPQFVQTVTGMGYRFIAPIADHEFRVEAGGVQAEGVQAAVAEATDTTPKNSPEAQPEAGNVVLPTAAEDLPKKSIPVRLAIFGGYVALTAFFVFLGIGLKPLAAHLPHRAATPIITSLAVLPLDNLSGDPAQNYFADGMTDELITMVAKNSTLRVVSRTSVMQYKGVHRPLPDIARELGVDGVLEGSVSRAGSRVHMTIQLIRADTDTHLWAESYDRDANDAVVLPNEAAETIAKHLNCAVAHVAVARQINPDAHDAYLRGHYAWVVGRNEDAGKYFQQAVQIQPDYALGWAGLAEYYAVGALVGQLDPLTAAPQAEAAGRKAVELDDSLPQAHNVLAAGIFFNRFDAAQALSEVTRAGELDPHYAETFHLRAKILCALGRYDDTIAIQKQSTAADPIEHPGAMAEMYLCTRRFYEAISDGRMRLKDFPAASDVLSYLADSYHWKHMDKEATEMLAREFTAEGNAPLAAAVRRAFESGGYTAVVRSELADLEKKARSGKGSPVILARLHAMLGEHDKTLALLDQSLRARAPLLLWIQNDPAFDFLHSDPRYRTLIQQIGLPPLY